MKLLELDTLERAQNMIEVLSERGAIDRLSLALKLFPEMRKWTKVDIAHNICLARETVTKNMKEVL